MFGPVKWLIVTTTVLLGVAGLVPRPIRLHRASAIGWVLFLAWGALLAVIAVDPLHHWIGTPDRHMGWMAWAMFAGSYVVGQQLVRESDRRLVLAAGAVATAGIGVYGLAEMVGRSPVDLAVESVRVAGPYGSPAYVGAALALLIPVCIGAAIDGLRGRWRALAWAASALAVVVVVASQTRAAWVGLAAAAVVTAGRWGPALARRRWVAAGVVSVVLVGAFAGSVASRVGDAFDADDGVIRGRIDEWQVGVTVVRNHPVTGVGFEGYRIAFAEGVDADYEQRYGRQVLPDRAHNGVLDVGVTMGVAGAAMYVVGLLFLARRVIGSVRRGAPWLAGIAAGVAAYCVQQQLLFPLAEVDPVFWLLAGMLVAATAEDEPTLVVRVPAVAGGAVAALAALALLVGLADVVADRRLDESLTLSAEGAETRALEAADRAFQLRPDSIRYAFAAATVASRIRSPSANEAALERARAGLALSPHDPLLRSLEAELLVARAGFSGSSADAVAAAGAWSELIDDDPLNAAHQLEAGVAFARVGDVAAAEQAWLVAAELAPDSPAPPGNLAVLYAETGRTQLALEMLDRLAALEPESPLIAEVRRMLSTATPP